MSFKSPYFYDQKVIAALKKYSDLIRLRTLVNVNPSLKVVATNGCFDILHAGHVQMLEAAKALGDILIVGLNSDDSVKKLKGPTRPINNQEDRKRVLSALRCVDFVQIFEEENSARFLSVCEPHVYVKAQDYNLSNLNVSEKRVLDEYGTKIELVHFIPNLSTTKIVKAL